MSDWQEERRHRDRARREKVMSLPVLQVRRHSVVDGHDGDVLVWYFDEGIYGNYG